MKGNYIYVVVSQSGTLTAKCIRKITGSKYCHVSVSTEKDLSTMYSFGRRFTYTPLFGGYVRETPNGGSFRRYPHIDAVILRFETTEEQFLGVKSHLEELYLSKKRYKYDYLGAIFALFHKNLRRKRKSYCSKFVREVLLRFGLCDPLALPEVVYPENFIEAFADKIVYEGNFQAYCRNPDEN